MRRRSAGRGGLRPTSAPRLAKSFEPGGGDATVKGHPNPFKAEHAQFLQERRQKSPGAGAKKSASPGRPATEVKKLRERQREHLVLQNLERLEDKHTASRAVQALEEVIGTSTSAEELKRFLRLGFDSKRPLVATKARQEQLLLLRSIVRQFHSLGGDDTSAATVVLKDRVMPILVNSLKSPDLQEAVITTLHDILDCHVPLESPEAAKQGFVQAGRTILKALLDPLALGAGWDAAVKRRCVMTLAAITPELLRRARHCQPADAEGTPGTLSEAALDPEAQALLETYARLLVHSLEVSSELHEGLLQCLVQLANDEAGRAGLLPRARELADLCVSHLMQTPSAQPLYVQQAKAELARSESPQRSHRARELTRELAMVCCLLLQRLAQELPDEEQEAEAESKPSLEALREQVLASLHRDNLNLHRLTRGHEPLRRAIAAARQAWEALTSPAVNRPPQATPGSKPRNRGVKSALAMRELLEEQEQKGKLRRSQSRPSGISSKDAEAVQEEVQEPTRSSTMSDACSTGVAAVEEVREPDAASLCSPGSDGMEEAAPDASPTPTMHPSQLEEDARWENRSPSITSTSWHFEAAPKVAADAVRLVDIRTTAAGPVPRMPQRAGAGRMSPPRALKQKETPKASAKMADAATEVTPASFVEGPGFLAEALPPRIGSEDCPLLAGIFDYIAAGRVELAMQSIFSLGNEKTLRAVLQRLDADEVWPRLPKPEAQHLAMLLVAMVCRDPFSSAASEACPWLEALLRRTRGEDLLPAQEMPALQGALFSASAVGGDAGTCAARLYFRLFQRQASASCPWMFPTRGKALPNMLPQSCP